MSAEPTDPDASGLEFTETAIAEARKAMEEESFDPDENGLRVIVREKDCDCGSMAYGMHFESDPHPEDAVFDHGDIRVFVDPKSYEHVEGATVDYVSGPGGNGFVVDVPKTGGNCGCGGHH
ncbi:MAG: HesB/IscA family protein [Halodesulfurarchaeum sp.]